MAANRKCSGAVSYTLPYYYVQGYIGYDLETAKLTTDYSTYGVLYNWPAACLACPSGWHLTGDAEWNTLIAFLGGENVAGGKMKETGTTRWDSPNTGATNESGFKALSGECRLFGDDSIQIGNTGYWWSSAESDSTSARERHLISNGNDFMFISEINCGVIYMLLEISVNLFIPGLVPGSGEYLLKIVNEHQKLPHANLAGPMELKVDVPAVDVSRISEGLSNERLETGEVPRVFRRSDKIGDEKSPVVQKYRDDHRNAG